MSADTGTQNHTPPPSEEEEFMIAADLTLYSNPLNRLLCRQAPADNGASKTDDGKAAKTNSSSVDENAIAADMKQYTNPLAELDKFHKTDKKD